MTETNKQKSHYMIIILFGIGLTLTIAALISHFYLPNVLETKIIDEFILDPESSSYTGWQKSNIPIYSYYYFFNITNANDLFKPGVKPILKEIGPYVFELNFEKVNISWNFENGTVEYRQIKTWQPVPSKSNGSLDDEIVHINVPLLVMNYYFSPHLFQTIIINSFFFNPLLLFFSIVWHTSNTINT